jgi:hypothetical protein
MACDAIKDLVLPVAAASLFSRSARSSSIRSETSAPFFMNLYPLPVNVIYHITKLNRNVKPGGSQDVSDVFVVLLHEMEVTMSKLVLKADKS